MSQPNVRLDVKASNRSRAFKTGAFFRKWGTLLGFVVLLLVFSVLRPNVFPNPQNLRNIIEQVATLAIVSAAVTVVMATGDFDLSVGTLASLVGVVTADLMVKDFGIVPSIFVGLMVGILGGLINGVLVAFGGLSAFVATLATMTAYGGAALFYTNGATIFSGIPEGFRVLGQRSLGPVPVSVLIMILAVGLVWTLMEHTLYGRRLYAIGGNPEAAYLSGIDVRKLRMLSFVISGFGAAVAGIVLTSRLFSAHPQAGIPFMLNAAAAVFLGATAFREGEPHVLGTLLGVFIMGVLGNGMNILGVNSYIQSVLTGVIIILAVLLSGLTRRNRV